MGGVIHPLHQVDLLTPAERKIFCVSGSKIPFSDIFFSARVKIAVSVSTDLEDDVIFFIKDF